MPTDWSDEKGVSKRPVLTLDGVGAAFLAGIIGVLVFGTFKPVILGLGLEVGTPDILAETQGPVVSVAVVVMLSVFCLGWLGYNAVLRARLTRQTRALYTSAKRRAAEFERD